MSSDNYHFYYESLFSDGEEEDEHLNATGRLQDESVMQDDDSSEEEDVECDEEDWVDDYQGVGHVNFEAGDEWADRFDVDGVDENYRAMEVTETMSNGSSDEAVAYGDTPTRTPATQNHTPFIPGTLSSAAQTQAGLPGYATSYTVMQSTHAASAQTSRATPAQTSQIYTTPVQMCNTTPTPISHLTPLQTSHATTSQTNPVAPTQVQSKPRSSRRGLAAPSPTPARAPKRSKCERVHEVLKYLRSQKWTLAGFLAEFSWGDRECMQGCSCHASLKQFRNEFFKSAHFARLLKIWSMPPRSEHSHKSRPVGGRDVIIPVAEDLLVDIYVKELKKVDPVVRPSHTYGRNELTQLSVVATEKNTKATQKPNCEVEQWYARPLRL
ncbi:hypothetical protein DAEQUDRAFT_763347 [Daedalea quercina L-15889]|uniref:Uncharacterized protein n=1 Tax=Daedalea quercina L-15889 TaxID=1314783 RepID=A0A165SDQ0_9APHY|nr:hypothetical protein DAEQUDRAFT_763347 [Daedalea quercina L-15889]